MVLCREEGERVICSQVRSKVMHPYNYYGIKMSSLSVFPRFGKVLWRNVPEDVAECALGLTHFSHLCFSDTKHSRIFNTKYVYRYSTFYQ